MCVQNLMQYIPVKAQSLLKITFAMYMILPSTTYIVYIQLLTYCCEVSGEKQATRNQAQALKCVAVRMYTENLSTLTYAMDM